MDVFCISLFLTILLFLYVKIIENEQAADNGKKKLVITEEHFQRVTQALVMRLRQHEESITKDGTSFWVTCLKAFIMTQALLMHLYPSNNVLLKIYH
jgi:hypothetical protein